jgi:hypothetical protein
MIAGDNLVCVEDRMRQSFFDDEPMNLNEMVSICAN